MYGDARAHLGTRRKKNKKFGDEFKVERETDGQREMVTVSLNAHPGAVVTVDFKNRPGILRHAALSDKDDWGNADIGIWFEPNAPRNIAAIGGKITLSYPYEIADLARFLARIAHSYAVASLGFGNFKSFLADAVTSEKPKHLPHYIGGRKSGMPNVGENDLHELMLSEVPHPTLPHLWLVSIRLFAPLGFPAYDVVVGEVTKPLR